MKVESIVGDYSRTFNLDDYENVKVAMRVTASLDEDETPDVVATALFAFLKQEVRIQSVPVLAARNGRRRKKLAKVLASMPESLRKDAEAFMQSHFSDVLGKDDGERLARLSGIDLDRAAKIVDNLVEKFQTLCLKEGPVAISEVKALDAVRQAEGLAKQLRGG